MNYSEVIESGLHLRLPKRSKYTERDINSLIVDSWVEPYKGRTFTTEEAVFIVVCTAHYHGAETSNTVKEYAVTLETRQQRGSLE